MSREIPLAGGRVTAGVVRVGDTVRRPRTENSDFVQQLLQHLVAKGFDAAPAWLGIDAEGRDMLSFIAGEVPPDLSDHADAVLIAAAGLIRRYHDAAADLVPDAETICHNDLSPCNFVFRDGLPAALIDFDAAAPGNRAHDLGYAAWLWLNLGESESSPTEQARRLKLFLEAYRPGVDGIIDAILRRQTLLIAEGDAAMAEWAERCRDWTEQHMLA